MLQVKIIAAEVAKVFAAYPPNIRTKLLFLRQVIIDTANEIPEVGELEETLKWGQRVILRHNQVVGV